MKNKADLAMAYNMKKKGMGQKMGGEAGCMDCMAMGGKCMAHGGAMKDLTDNEKYPKSQYDNYASGGEVENEDLDPSHEEPMPEGMMEDLDAMKEDDEIQSPRPGMTHETQDESRTKGQSIAMQKYAKGGSVVDEIMRGRKKMASGGMLEDEPVESDFEPHINMEPVHTRQDEAHNVESPSLDDESLVGQILKERKMRRRG